MRRALLLVIATLFSSPSPALVHARVCKSLFIKEESFTLPDYLEGSPRVLRVDLSGFEGPIPGAGDQYIKARFAMMKISKDLAQLKDQPQISTAVYPSSGFDAGTAFTIFSEARTIIGIDQHPFYKGEEIIKPALFRFLTRPTYTVWSTVDRSARENGLAAAIIGSLASDLPGFRLISVTEYKESSTVSHGVIQFDLGPGTPIQKYIHLHKTLPTLEDTGWPAWMMSLTQNGYDALLIKGSMETFSLEQGGGDFLLQAIASKGGVVVDADNFVDSGYYKDQGAIYRRYQSQASTGYGSGVKFFIFKPTHLMIK